MPRSILRKSSSVEQCEDRQCRIHLPIRCTSASSVVCSNDGGKSPDRDSLHYKQAFCDGFRQNVHCSDPKCTTLHKESFKKYHHSHDSDSKQCSPCGSCKSSSPLASHDGIAIDKKPGYSFENFKDENLMQDLPGKNIPYPYSNENLMPSFDQKSDGATVDAHINCLHGRCCSCDTQNRSSDEFHGSQCSCDICTLESERPPQEFLVSPTQNTLMYPEISDSYTLQNFSGGGKFFQEALRRKTGLVENLRKATQIIFEHHKNSSKKGVDLSYSMGQKILTWLCPAVHTILSDGLLPSVQGFFGPLPNSPWKVAGASIKQGETRKDVEELLNHVTSEKLLTDSTYRFNAFILGLLNLGCF
ncbi:iporin [Caerostris extrusa]|uniref:Iporin n=1 Tax=Caerostris extrusa TaxID=172846 RepID=A0AAV4XCR0_CAEEX|nr:iporin [Caerostris extrusa]